MGSSIVGRGVRGCVIVGRIGEGGWGRRGGEGDVDVRGLDRWFEWAGWGRGFMMVLYRNR